MFYSLYSLFQNMLEFTLLQKKLILFYQFLNGDPLACARAPNNRYHDYFRALLGMRYWWVPGLVQEERADDFLKMQTPILWVSPQLHLHIAQIKMLLPSKSLSCLARTLWQGNRRRALFQYWLQRNLWSLGVRRDRKVLTPQVSKIDLSFEHEFLCQTLPCSWEYRLYFPPYLDDDACYSNMTAYFLRSAVANNLLSTQVSSTRALRRRRSCIMSTCVEATWLLVSWKMKNKSLPFLGEVTPSTLFPSASPANAWCEFAMPQKLLVITWVGGI